MTAPGSPESTGATRRICDHRWASADRCTAPALWQMVYDDEDAAACGRHLNAVLLIATESGWVKVDRIPPADQAAPAPCDHEHHGGARD